MQHRTDDERADTSRTDDQQRRDEQRGSSPEGRTATSTATAVDRGPDEQGTVPEDRDAAATAEGRSTTGTPPADGTDRFEVYDGSDREDYRRRWNTIQAGFVDDPRAAAEQADALVGELVDRLSQKRQELHDELGRGDDRASSDTETMRLAIRRYRALFRAMVRE